MFSLKKCTIFNIKYKVILLFTKNGKKYESERERERRGQRRRERERGKREKGEKKENK